MSKKTKGKIFIFLWKLTIILSLIGIVLTCIADDEQMQLIFFLSSILLFIMMIVIGIIGEKYVDFRKITTAEKYHVNINGYNDISYYLSNNNFERGSIKVDENIYGDIYYKIKKNIFTFFDRKITLVTTINMKTYDGKTKELIMKKINDWLLENFEERNGDFDFLELALVLCLDSINDKFKNYINRDIYQDKKLIILPVGIVFDEKNVCRSAKRIIFKRSLQKIKEKIYGYNRLYDSKIVVLYCGNINNIATFL